VTRRTYGNQPPSPPRLTLLRRRVENSGAASLTATERGALVAANVRRGREVAAAIARATSEGTSVDLGVELHEWEVDLVRRLAAYFVAHRAKQAEIDPLRSKSSDDLTERERRALCKLLDEDHRLLVELEKVMGTRFFDGVARTQTALLKKLVRTTRRNGAR
jgi:hypothetical protein